MNQEVSRDNNYGKDYCARVSERISKIIEEKRLTQNQIVKLCEDAGAPISQATISNIKRGATTIALSSVINICKGLNIDINDVLSLEKMDDTIKTNIKGRGDPTKNIAYKGYFGLYHVYFFPTISDKHELLHGILDISPSKGEDTCKATMQLYTGDIREIDGEKEEIVKKYEGDFFISLPMQSGYCLLKNSEIEETCFLIFHHWHILNNELLCRMAVAATTSAGGNRRPTIHRLYMSRHELPEENQKYIKGQLRLNSSEIIISENNYKRLLSEIDISDKFKEIFKREAKLESYFNISEAKLMSCEISGRELAQSISLLRDYSVSPKYNKVSTKTDEFIFKYYQELEK